MFERVKEQYMKDVAEHARMCAADPYYRHSCGGGTVPEPSCKYCASYDGEHCMREWNNADPDYYIRERDDREPDDLCNDYTWAGEWEED